MGKGIEQNLSELYMSNLDIIGDGLPSWVNSMRREYLEAFNLLGMPTAATEKYRHSDMREAFAGEWEYYFTPQNINADITDICPGAYRIDVVNGFCKTHAGVNITAEGMLYGSLREAFNFDMETTRKYYNSVADNENEAVAALNSVFMQDGAFIYLPAGVVVEKPVVVNFAYVSEDPAQMCFPRMLVIAGKGASANIVISHETHGKAKLAVDFVRETIVEEGANVSITGYSRMNEESVLVENNYMKQAESSAMNMMNVWFSGGMTRVNYNAGLVGRGSESKLYAMFLANGEERPDINMVVNHLVPDCMSSELVKGIVSGQAQGAFTGKVYVAQDAQRTVAYQQSRNIQLSENSRVYTEPQLEIYADDVKCSHGATVGQMDDEAVYYMRQRGISEEDAKKLQLSGFVNDIISHCTVESVCEHIAKIAEERIAQL